MNNMLPWLPWLGALALTIGYVSFVLSIIL